MSVAAGPQRIRQRYTRVLRHSCSTRGVEVCALQAAPLLGAHHGGVGLQGNMGQLVLLLIGSTALTAHAFLFNDWADYTRDARDPRRARLSVDDSEIGRGHFARVALVLLLLAGLALAAVGTSAVLFGAGIAALSPLYSFSRLGKSAPIAASVEHLLGGSLLFLLGYSVGCAVDARGIVLSLVFGLVFAAGHLNQEVRDYDSDRINRIGTVAVRFGCRRAFVASFCLFTTAYLLIIGLAATSVLPKILLASGILWLLQARWTLQAMRRGLGYASAVWLQSRYRLLFAVIGITMLLS